MKVFVYNCRVKRKSGAPKPTDAEWGILEVLWNRGPSTVREVHEVLHRARPAQYTTTLKLMQIMAEKGLVARDERERAHRYSAAVQRDAMRARIAGELVQRAFGGSAATLMQSAISGRKTSREELAEIRRILDEFEGGNNERN